MPIVPDESRTFGMEGLFRQLGIYASRGQLYEPVDSRQLIAYYREDKTRADPPGGHQRSRRDVLLDRGRDELSYANHGLPMIPFFIFYSMFGFQRVGDLIWAAGDSRVRGASCWEATSGRTTLNGEGLQHQDGHSHLLAATVPNCISYDPSYAYELAVILQDGLRRMYGEDESVFYYITVENENYRHPPCPRARTKASCAGCTC